MFTVVISISLGILLSWLNLFVASKYIISKKAIFVSLLRWVFLSFIILLLLKFKVSPIFLAVGFALFPFIFSIWAIKNGRR